MKDIVSNPLKPFIKVTQYLANLTASQDIYSEVKNIILASFKADCVCISEKTKRDEIVCLCSKKKEDCLICKNKNQSEIFKVVKDVFDTEFLSFIDYTGEDSLSGVILPITENYSVKKVLIIGYKENLKLEKEIIDCFLAIAGIIGTMLGRISIEKNLEKLVNERTKELEISKKVAEKASKAKSQFLANMSHEIRTPLNGIIGFTDLLINTNLEEIQKEYAHYIRYSATSLSHIINDILDFSKIEAGKMKLDIIKVDLHKIINQLYCMFKYQVEGKKFKFILNIPDNLPHLIETDPVRLKQIIMNLLSNAIKFTNDGEIELKVEFEVINDSKVLLTFYVRDTGIGITKEQQSKLFRAFSQAENSTSRKYGGTGLGLAISNLIAKKMNSNISLKSEIGKGSTFYFKLITTFEYNSLQNNQEPQLNKESQLDSLCSTNNSDVQFMCLCEKEYSLLIVEDNTVNMVLTNNIMKKLFKNINIIEATNGIEALKAFEKNQFDLILMDVEMPEMDGLETTKIIRKIEQQTNKHVPIIALTAHALTETVDKCYEAGMDKFITKPIKLESLKEVLVELLLNENKEKD